MAQPASKPQTSAEGLAPLARVEATMPPAQLVLTAESWNEVVSLVEAPPEPTEDLHKLFHDER